MKRIHCAEGINAVIPEHLREMRIDLVFLKGKHACNQGICAFKSRFPDGCLYPELREWLVEIERADWESWALLNIGGDIATAGGRGTATAGDSGTATAGDRGTATAGDSGTATAGHRGTATAGYRGTATAGDRGTATAGDSGTATAGYRGTATAGYRGTATAGYRGTATAGDSGVISIQYFDTVASRFRVMIGYIGEGGLMAGVKYRLNEQAQFEEVEA